MRSSSLPSKGVCRCVLYLVALLAVDGSKCRAENPPITSPPRSNDTYNYGEDHRALTEIRQKNADIRKELSSTNMLIDALENLRRETRSARYPATIGIDQKDASQDAAKLPTSFADAQTAFVRAFPDLSESRMFHTEQSYRDALENLSQGFLEHLPTAVINPTQDDFKKLSVDQFQKAKGELDRELTKAIEPVRSRTRQLEKDLIQSESQLVDQSSKFWRHLSGRDQEDKDYRVIGVLGLSAMAAAALLCTSILVWLGRNARLPEHFTEYLRWNPLLDITTVFLLTFAIVILGLNRQLTSEVLGTLIGGISGYVLGRATRASSAAQAQEIREIVRGTPNPESSSEGVTTAMEELEEKYLLPDNLSQLADNQLTLAEIEKHLDGKSHDRAIIFQPAANNSGSARGVLHASVIKAFLAKQAKQPAQQQLSSPTFDDLLKDADFKPIFDNSAAWVRSSDKLSDAKAAMDSKSRTLGSRGNCYDVLVTQNGLSNEHVLGIITNEILQRKARV